MIFSISFIHWDLGYESHTFKVSQFSKPKNYACMPLNLVSYLHQHSCFVFLHPADFLWIKFGRYSLYQRNTQYDTYSLTIMKKPSVTTDGQHWIDPRHLHKKLLLIASLNNFFFLKNKMDSFFQIFFYKYGLCQVRWKICLSPPCMIHVIQSTIQW